MSQPSQSLRNEYRNLFDTLEIRAEHAKAIDKLCARALALVPRYEPVSAATGVPWYFIAAVHLRESTFKIAHLHNNDPLTARTVHVPAFREVRRQIDATALPPDDARRRLLAEARSVCVIMEEALALPTVALDDGRSTQHVDRERARQLERELRDAYARVEQAITDLNQKKTEPKEAHAPSPPAPGL